MNKTNIITLKMYQHYKKKNTFSSFICYHYKQKHPLLALYLSLITVIRSLIQIKVLQDI